MQYIFGPVNSRRLGRSLGVDLLPFKTCSLDCLYCECGWTTTKTLERAEWVPTAAVIAELDAWLADQPPLDYITFAGSGEPTLHTGLGQVIAHIKAHYPQYRVAVLTNACSLAEPAVRADLQQADLVVPSLDAATPKVFRLICRPVPGMDVRAVIDGIADFRAGFRGLMLLEIFLVPGRNDTPGELAALKEAALRIAPDAIQLNHLDRPAPEQGLVAPVSAERLAEIRDYFAPLQVQIVRSRAEGETAPWDAAGIFREVLAARARGADTLARLSVALGMREGDLAKTLARMESQSLLRFDRESGFVHA